MTEERIQLADLLRELVRKERSVYRVAKDVGISQPTLHEFVNGRPDGRLADMRLSVAQKLIDHFGVKIEAPN